VSNLRVNFQWRLRSAGLKNAANLFAEVRKVFGNFFTGRASVPPILRSPPKGGRIESQRSKADEQQTYLLFYNLYLCPRSPLISVPKITLVSGTLFIIFDNTVTVRLTILAQKHVQEVLSCWHWNSPKQDSLRSFVVAQHLSRSAFLSHNYPCPTITLNSVLTTWDTFRSWVQLAAK
jgi:hypothetical protein